MRPQWLATMLMIDMPRHRLLVTCHKVTSLTPTPVQGSALLLREAALQPEEVAPSPEHRELVDPVDVEDFVEFEAEFLVTVFARVATTKVVDFLMVLQFLC